MTNRKERKFVVIEYDKRYESKVKGLYQQNIARTAVPNGQEYQKQLYQKYGAFAVCSLCLFLIYILSVLLAFVFGQSLSILFSCLLVSLFFIGGYTTLLVRLLIYYYCYNVFQHDFKHIEVYYGKDNDNRLWLAVDEETDQVLGVTALDADSSLLSDKQLWHLFQPKNQTKKREDIRTCELKRMSVSPNAAGLGLGKILTQTVLKYAEEKGFDFAYLTTYEYNKAAIKLYSSCGFNLAINFPFDKVHQMLALDVAFMIKELGGKK